MTQLPSISRRLASWREAMKRWRAAGKPVRSDAEVARIHAICVACDYYDSKREACKLCGCRCNKQSMAQFNKIRMATERCPLDDPKWGMDVALEHDDVKVIMNPVMDVVIPLASGNHGKKVLGSKWDNNELRYCLRSLEKYFPDLGRVFIVTEHLPEWLTNVVHIKAKDVHTRNKDANLIDKVLLACKSGVSPVFLRCSDDQCLLQEFDGHRVWHLGEFGREGGGKWWDRYRNTCEYLEAHGKPTFFYDCHVPVPVARDVFAKVAEAAPYQEPPGMCINTLYFNFLDLPQITVMNGQKATIHRQADIATIRRECQNAIFLGYNNDALQGDMEQFLQERFPEPSRFEKDVSVVQHITKKRPPMIVVAAPHRSGTSCVAGVLHNLGVSMGSDLYPAMPNRNAMGFFESTELMQYLESITRPTGYAGFTNTREQRVAWLRRWADTRTESQIIGCKSAMLCLMISELKEVWPDLKVITVERPLADVAMSIRQQGWNHLIPHVQGWKERRDAAIVQENLPVLRLKYYDLLDNPGPMIDKLAKFAGVTPTADDVRLAHAFVRKNLCHHRSPPPLWSLWFGHKPPYVSLCQETLLKHNPNARILSVEEFKELQTEDLDIDLSHLRPANQVDWMRLYLIKHFGGIWVDADCIVMRSLDPLLQAMDVCHSMTYFEPPHGRKETIGGGFIGGPAGSPHFAEMYERATYMVRRKDKVSWRALMGANFEHVLKHQSWQGFLKLDYNLFYPVKPHRNRGELLSEASDEEHAARFPQNLFTAMLSHNLFPRKLRNMGRDELLSSRRLLSYFFRRAMS